MTGGDVFAGRVRAPGEAHVESFRDDRVGAEGVPRRARARALKPPLGGPLLPCLKLVPPVAPPVDGVSRGVTSSWVLDYP